MRIDSPHSERRDLLKYLGAGGLVGLAGCTSSESGGDEQDTTTESSTTESSSTDTEDDSGEASRDGMPVVGIGNEPRGFNPLTISDSSAWAIMDQLYVYPTVRDPDDPNETVGFAFSDWEFDPDSLTGSATIREGMTWTDGEDFTADDVAFTFEYLMENEGHRFEANVGNFEEITATDTHEIEFTLQDEVAAVFTPDTGAFAVPILPEHVWSEVDDYTEYAPDSIVGAGGFEWEDASEGNWYELSARPDALPDEIHEGPYVDGLRFRVFGETTALINSLKNGEADLTYDSITPNRAFQLQDSDDVTVWDAPSRGYNYIALNMRRVPFDDRAFRQSLGFVYPYDYLVNNLRKGLSTPGDYAAANVYDPWRPDDFETPFEHGPHQTEDGKLDVERVRSFLENADGEHDYTFDSVESSEVTGDKEIRVDGELLTEAHTDNDGESGQGPLKMMLTPPSASPVVARACARFVENLNEVGIPAEQEPVAENSQTSRVQGNEDFDMWESQWIYMPKPHMYLGFWLHSSRADLESETEDVHLNPMGYTGADDLITEVQSTYDPEEQQAATREALATIYQDAPALITEYPNRLHATTNTYDGWVKMPGGISQNPWSYLNVSTQE
ncbi:ABC transporter substrate-binding protein (plasmid) [Halorussus salilacus]|uniref:ABC transporter substrate-binding protein n=1 Tax=Halorussus salilacus TaxID=2953750 RepID=UPI0020A159AF|nr:ABC transporter substrate-binding protein [Halorussus salilacus]USZ70139.1 ABC transporter substrate-binding protein [Halorussus salilacus]